MSDTPIDFRGALGPSRPRSARFPIIVYGATGYTGRLVCAELRRAGAVFAIAGRDPQKLHVLRVRLGLERDAALCAEGQDVEGMARVFAQGRVVLTCAGPFGVGGPRVLDAALRAGVHYLDIAGEYEHVLATQARDAEARAAGVALVSAVGYDTVPTDCAAVLASAGLDRVERLRIAWGMVGGGASHGTLRSMLRFPRAGVAYRDGAYIEEEMGQHLWEVEMPEPLGRRPCLSIPWGDVATAPRSTGARSVRVYVALPWGAVPLLRLGLPPVLRMLGVGLLRGALDRAVALLPDGPTAAVRARARNAVVAEAMSSTGECQKAWVRTMDGYEFTAASAAQCAQWAARPEFAGRGALTPTQAFGARALLDTLRERGVTYGLGPAPQGATACEATGEAGADSEAEG